MSFSRSRIPALPAWRSLIAERRSPLQFSAIERIAASWISSFSCAAIFVSAFATDDFEILRKSSSWDSARTPASFLSQMLSAVSIIGTAEVFSTETIEDAPPRSSRWSASTSSIRRSLLFPERESALPAPASTFWTCSALRMSLAFISMSSRLNSLLSAYATVVLPVPVGPWMRMGFCLTPRSQFSIHCFILVFASSLPARSSILEGIYFCASSMRINCKASYNWFPFQNESRYFSSPSGFTTTNRSSAGKSLR